MSAGDIDPLLFLRQAIAAGTPVVPTATDAVGAPETPLPQAHFLQFLGPSGDDAAAATTTALPVDAPTRFLSHDAPVDLRSIYFAWLNREVAIPEYNAAATRLNDALAAAGSAATYIRSTAGDRAGAAAGGAAGAKAAAGAAAPSARAGRGTLLLDPRLAVIYSGERRMGDHNTVLRGSKPTTQDFSHVRKLAVPFMSKKHNATTTAGGVGAADKKMASALPAPRAALPLNPKVGGPPARRPDPIILLSPSASSLLRMSNIKAFLEGGRYVPADISTTSATMLHLTRTLKDIDPARPLRFILVEGPEHFKPEYWDRVVAVFTTGQAWQFKSYKWSHPAELFKHVLGVYVGWRGEPLPPGVREWGHRVLTCQVDKWTDPAVPGAEAHRWRDREVAETIWKAIEHNMRQKGWKRDTGATLA
ncbi:pol 2 transcription elongation factor subunit [Niveomyces insectorum RCEF 264]|uniref:Pol 2 transcription elongation factor subunit n=1 Tax=Niveomyces insectorum RCEF 264 TaxID=1081102 RepID=A0A167NAW1_9HYPO|nr:pol 2 transcription elongation factor subunit [Niveomyces insectorum RCEF 264]